MVWAELVTQRKKLQRWQSCASDAHDWHSSNAAGPAVAKLQGCRL